MRSATSRWLPEPGSTIFPTSAKWSETRWPETSQAVFHQVELSLDLGGEVGPVLFVFAAPDDLGDEVGVAGVFDLSEEFVHLLRDGLLFCGVPCWVSARGGWM
jgi:hypothetical protein